MKKKYRLKKNWEFSNIMALNKQLVNQVLVVYFKPSDSFRAGFTVPKKFANAVGRNFYKRQLRAIIHEINMYHLNYDFVFIVRKSFLKTNYETKKQSIKRLLENFKNEERKIK